MERNVCSFVRLFICSFIRPSVHSSVYSFVRSLIRLFIRSFIVRSARRSPIGDEGTVDMATPRLASSSTRIPARHRHHRPITTSSSGNVGSRFRCHRGGASRAEQNSEESDLMPCTHVRVVGERRTREMEWQQKKGTEWSPSWSVGRSVGRLAVLRLICSTHALHAEISDAYALARRFPTLPMGKK